MSKNPSVSVIIPAHNAWDGLKQGLPALLRQTFPMEKCEVILVDDGSTDGTRRRLEKLGLPGLRVLRFRRNQGRSAARNLGIRSSRGRYLIFLDADVVPGPDFVRAHLYMLQAFPRAFVQGEVRPHPETSVIDRARIRGGRYLKYHHGQILEYLSITWNLSIRREHLEAVGCFDESFRGYGFEDYDLGYRLVAQRGLELRYSKKALAYHRDRHGFEAWLQKEHERGRSFVFFVRRHPEILAGRSWPESRGLFLGWLKEALSFSPFGHAKALAMHRKLRVLERKGRDHVGDFLSCYREARAYTFREAAYATLCNLGVRKPLLLKGRS